MDAIGQLCGFMDKKESELVVYFFFFSIFNLLLLLLLLFHLSTFLNMKEELGIDTDESVGKTMKVYSYFFFYLFIKFSFLFSF